METEMEEIERIDTEKQTEESKGTDKKSKEYSRLKFRLQLADIALSLIFLLVIIFTGFTMTVRNFSESVFSNAYLSFLLFSFIIGGTATILSLPLSFYSGYLVERRYGLSNENLWGWTKDSLKSLGLSILLFLPVGLTAFALLRHTGEWWWLPVAAFIFVFAIIVGKVFPVLILPIFYKLKPLEDQSLTRRLSEIAEDAGLSVSTAYSFDMSKSTKKVNAGLTGFGNTRRIIIADNMLNDFTEEEIASVFAHEVGHYVHKHLLKGMAVAFVNIFLGMFITAQLYHVALNYMDFRGPADPAALPLLLLFLSCFGLLVMPLQNMLSRSFERQADRYAVLAAGNGAAFISGMSKMEEINLDDPEPDPIVEFLFYSHPATGKRIDNIRRAAEETAEGPGLSAEDPVQSSKEEQ